MSDDNGTPVYLVYGATGGMGSALVRRLAASGGTVYAAARDADKLKALTDEVGCTGMVVDALDAGQVDAAVDQAKESGGRLDGVANCVGSLLLKPAHATKDEEWRHTIDTSLTSAFYVVRAAAKALRKGGGSIALVSSAAGRIGLANHEAIAAAKAGVIGLTLSAAASYGSSGVRVNCVAPGMTMTPLTEPIAKNEASLKASEAMHVLGRAGQPEEVASALAWLLHPDQAWVTGQVLGVDGGLGTVRSRK